MFKTMTYKEFNFPYLLPHRRTFCLTKKLAFLICSPNVLPLPCALCLISCPYSHPALVSSVPAVSPEASFHGLSLQ